MEKLYMELGLNLFIGEDVFKYCFNFEVSQNHAVSLEKVLQENPLLGSFFQIFGNTGLFDKQALEANPTYVVWTKERKIDLEKYVENYKAYFPKLNELKKIFEQLKENECICVLPSRVPINTCTRLTIWEELDKRNKTKSRGMEEFFYPITKNYNMFCFVGNQDKKVGQVDRTKRVCRWCHNKMDVVTFKEKAHAISEALGNKNLILLDECDSCNHRFANTIEKGVISYFEILATYWAVKGKRGVKKIKTSSFEMVNKGNNEVEISTDQEDFKETHLLKIGKGKIPGQDIYKAFCKYALSLVDEEIFKLFDWTVRWINGDNEVSRVPLVRYRDILGFVFKFPEMLICVRKNENGDLPQMFGVFFYTNTAHLFVVPKDKGELDKFVNEENFEKFLKTLPDKFVKGQDKDFSGEVEPLAGTIFFNKKSTGTSLLWDSRSILKHR